MAGIRTERRYTVKTLNGSMTIEAALLMPIVWFSMFFLIFVGFFQYDRCVAEQDSKIIALHSSVMREKDEAEVLRGAMENGELTGKKKLLFSNSVRRELHMTKNKVTIKISGKVNTILNSLWKEGNLAVFSYDATYEVKTYDPVKDVRIRKRLKDLWKE